MGSYTTPLTTVIVSGTTVGHVAHSSRLNTAFNSGALSVTDPTDFGVKFDNNTASAAANDTGFAAAITAARATLNGSEGAILECPVGVAYISSAILLKNRVRLRGQGRSASRIKAVAGFSSTALIAAGGASIGIAGTSVNRMVELGHGDQSTSNFAFGSLVEDMAIDANSVVGLIPVFSQQANEQSGVDRCIVSGFRGFAGIYWAPGTSIVRINDVEVYAASEGATYGIVSDAWGQNYIRNATVNGNSVNKFTSSIMFTTDLHIYSCHTEQATDGVECKGIGTIIGVYGHSGTTNVVRVRAGSRALCLDIVKNSSTNVIVDETTGGVTKTLDTAFYLASEPHAGGRQTVSGSRGGNAALASLLAAGVAQGLIRDTTTA